MPKTIFSDNTNLVKDKRFTYLSSDVASGATTLSVQSIIGFESLGTSSGQILVIGEIGNENTEIIKTSSSTGPSGTTITLNSGLAFSHPQDSKVYIVDWDRLDFQWSATATGTKSTLRAYPLTIQPDLKETLYVDTAQSSGFYFVRFNETVGNTNSDWSDPVPFGGYPDNSVFAVKKRAIDSINEQIDPELITHDFLNTALWEGRREYHDSPGIRPFRIKLNQILGTVSAGMYRLVLPADVEKPYTAQNIFRIRVGLQPNMSYYDKRYWDADYNGIAHTTLKAANAVGDKDVYCTNVGDFAASGSVNIEGDSIAYSAVGVQGGTLRISTQGTTSHVNGSDVWQNVSLGMPQFFTVFADVGGSAYIYFSSPFSTTYANENIYADYYRMVVDQDSDADILDEPEYDMFVPYLAWRIKLRKNKGNLPVARDRSGRAVITDPDFQTWQAKKINALTNEYLGREIRISPDTTFSPGNFSGYST